MTTMPARDDLRGRRLAIVVNTDWFFLSHRLPVALAASAAGAEVWIVATDTGRAEEIRAHGLRFEDARISRGGLNAIREASTVVRLTGLLHRIRPDLVHLVATKAIVYGGLAARFARVPAVVCAVTGAGYALGPDRDIRLQRLVRLLLKLVLRPASVVVFQHEDDRDLFRSHDMVRHGQTVLVKGVGVDVDTWLPVPDAREQVVMLAARLIEEKGVLTFVEAARRLRLRFPDARFVLLGSLETALPTGVPKHRIDAWMREGLIEWWGYRADMRETLARCQVFVLPTYHNEGVPKVLLEAGALQRAIVASDIPGCRAVIDHGVNGLLVPPRDPVRLADEIAHLLENPRLRQRLAAAARADVAARFREDVLTSQVLDTYRRALVPG